jgi:DNA-binding beta-propeller fold protein YncE
MSIAVSPDGKSAYVNDYNANAISPYSISPATGKLTPMSPKTVAAPGRPNSIKVAPDGNNAYVTSENKGVLSQFAISLTTGKITPLSPATVTIPPSGSLGVAVTSAK